MVTGSNTRAGHLQPTYTYKYQADLEKTEKDLADDKKVRALTGQGRLQTWG